MSAVLAAVPVSGSWIAFVIVGLGSYVFRLVPMIVGGRVGLSPTAERSVHHAGIAALTALIVSAAVPVGPASQVGASVLAVGVGTVVAIRGGSMLRITVVGYAVFVAAHHLAERVL